MITPTAQSCFACAESLGHQLHLLPDRSIHLQGRFDSWPKRRGVTRVAELDRAGINVCFAQDSIQDPWYPLGNGNILRILDAGLHICHMLGYDDLASAASILVTDNSARALCLEAITTASPKAARRTC